MSSAASLNSTIVLKTALGAALRTAFTIASRLLPGVAVRSAARLMTTPVRARRARASAMATTASMREFAAGEHTLKIYTWGDPGLQPYVLMVHGWSSYGLRFEPWVQGLREAGYAVVSFDQQAHGLSSGKRATAPDFARNLLAVGTHFGSAAGIVAHSLGGAATIRALGRGLDARRVVMIAPAGDMVAVTHRFARLVGLAEHLCGRLIRLFETRSAVTFDEQHAHHSVRPIARPLLVIHDLVDNEVPWEEGERYVRHASDARLLSTSGLGHHRIVNDAKVIDASLRFLRGETIGDRVVSSPNLPYGVF
jgi:pimeloyl-ACP methyl ester carboxylesterase